MNTQRSTWKQRALSLLLTAAIIVSLLPLSGVTAFAAAPTAPTMGTNKYNTPSIWANGIPITIEAGTTSGNTKIKYNDGTKDVYLDLDPNTDGVQEEADLSAYSIYGGAADSPVSGTDVTMTGGTIKSLLGGGGGGTAYAAAVTGNTSITMTGGSVTSELDGGGDRNRVDGNTVVTFRGTAFAHMIYGGGGFCSVGGNTTMNINGGTVNIIYGGSQYANISGNTYITMTGGTVNNRIVGGGSGVQSQPQNTYLSITGGTVKGAIYAGSEKGTVLKSANLFIGPDATVTATVSGGNSGSESKIPVANGSVATVGVAATDSFTNLVYKTDAATWAVQGDIALNVTIGAGETLTIPQDSTVTVLPDASLTVNGTLTNNGTIQKCGTITGDIGGSGGVKTMSAIAELTPETAVQSDSIQVTVTVTGFDGQPVTAGSVSLYLGDTKTGTFLTSANIADGKATFNTVVNKWPLGTNTLTAAYKETDSSVGASVTKTCTVNASFSISGWTYGQDANTPDPSHYLDGYTVAYTYYTDNNCTVETTPDHSGAATNGSVPVNAGDYYVKAVVGPKGQYTGGSAVAKFTIANANLTDVSVAQNGTLAYTGEALTAQVQTAATATNGAAVTFTYAAAEAGSYGSMPTFTTVGDHTVYYKASAANHNDSTGSFTVTVTNGVQTAPVLTSSDETISGKKDGTIIGLTTDMEYSTEATGKYTSVQSTAMTFAPGTYYVRYAAKDQYDASPATELIIAASSASYSVTVPSTQPGYTLTVDKTSIGWHEDVTLTYLLKDGYAQQNGFAIQINGVTITPDSNGTYTIQNSESNVVITVTGVADVTVPTGSIAIGTNRWTQFLNTVTFGLFFKTTQTVTVTAADTGSGVLKAEYLLSDIKFSTEAAVTGTWNTLSLTAGAASFSINPSSAQFIYVKLTDNDNNVSILNSDGIVLYTDSVLLTDAAEFNFDTLADIPVTMTLNGNTLAGVKNGNTALIGGTDYTVSGSTVTLSQSYLAAALADGSLTLTFTFDPMGIATDNATLTAHLTVTKHTHT